MIFGLPINIKKEIFNILLSIISGILLAFSSVTLNSYLAWIALVPLFIAVYDNKIKSSILNISIFTTLLGGIGYLWIPETIQRYNGTYSIVSFAGMLALIVSNLLLLIIWIIAYKYLIINSEKPKTKSIIYNTVLISILYFLIEFININLFPGVPWNKFNLRNTIASNEYFIQTASLFGSVGLSLFIISVNYLIAEFIRTRNKTGLMIGIGIFLANLAYGVIILNSEQDTKNKRTVALVCENVKAETKWTEEGDDIIAKMLDLINEVKTFKPGLIVWPESALPWTYIENDDILLAIAGILKGNETQNIIGYLTQSESDSNLVYNSAYLIDKNGRAIGRYDKNILLDFIEKPLLSDDYSNLLPMLVQSQYDNVLPGKDNKLLHTSIGKCKVEICNESLVPEYFYSGDVSFEFMVNISNDAWLVGTQNIELHFYLARLKAVEYRKYLIINSNRGISGIVDNKGRVQVSSQAEVPEKLIGYIIPNKDRTLYSRFPLLLPALAFLIIIIFTKNKLKK